VKRTAALEFQKPDWLRVPVVLYNWTSVYDGRYAKKALRWLYLKRTAKFR
jgi:hypothetical protein